MKDFSHVSGVWKSNEASAPKKTNAYLNVDRSIILRVQRKVTYVFGTREYWCDRKATGKCHESGLCLFYP